MEKVYKAPEILSEKLEFGVFGCYHVSTGKPGNNGIGHAFGIGFFNDPSTFGNHGRKHFWWRWKHRNR
jgi:hypothetical protein